MKKILSALLVVFLSFSAFSSEIVSSSKDESFRVLDLVVGVKRSYSGASSLEVKVIELLAGDGFNPTRLVLILSTGNPYEKNRIFELDAMVNELTRVTFTGIDQILLNYTQDTFDQDGNDVKVKKSMKIQVLRNARGELSGKIKILD